MIPILLLSSLSLLGPAPQAYAKEGVARVTVLTASPQLHEVVVDFAGQKLSLDYSVASRDVEVKGGTTEFSATAGDAKLDQKIHFAPGEAYLVVLTGDKEDLQAKVLSAHWTGDQAHLMVFPACEMKGCQLRVDGKTSGHEKEGIHELSLPAGKHTVALLHGDKVLVSRDVDLKVDHCYQMVALGQDPSSMRMVMVTQARPALHG